ncbi:YunG family protein [Saccharopolyspora hordei]|uniref:YunG family protein n=1 Tax=Saccharopolyspora hordei TaxID=1838 RepID=UPI00406BAB08
MCPEDLPAWHAGNPARGQCGVTALVVHDLLGGDLLRGEVHVDGRRVDHHWWDRLPGGLEVDLTREQFGPEDVVTAGVVVARPPRLARRQEECARTRTRTLAALAGSVTRAGPRGPGARRRPWRRARGAGPAASGR